MAINLIEAFVKRNENSSSLVIVPTQILKDQWVDQLEERGLESNARVEIINSAIKLN
jgi:superfamily II DNA or RNA helicase